MLKGTMKIQLTDVNTGKTETVVEHNMVTNALQEIFRPLGLVKDPGKMYEAFAPYYQKLLGGILLFDSEIEENPGNIYPPAGARLVGCAAYGQQNNTKGTLRGGFNQTESELNLADRYMKYVYDFATSQANGTIACVCLTHVNGGFTSYGSGDAVYTGSYPLGVQVDNGYLQYVHTSYTGSTTGDQYSGFTKGKTELLFLIDRKTDTAYYFRIDSDTQITIIKRRAYLKTVSVLENPRTNKYLTEEIPVSDGVDVSGNIAYNFDPVTRSLYIFAAAASPTKAGGEFRVLKVEFDTWRITTFGMTNTADVSLQTNGMRFGFAHDGFVYLKSYNSPYHIYKFELGNPANVVKLAETGMSTIPGTPRIGVNGRIYYENYDDYLYIANGVTDEVLKPENIRLLSSGSREYCYTPMLDEPLLYFVSCGDYTAIGFMMLANYLATINNLSEPVTKTADKTMKVTYIIQEQ